MTAYVTSPLLNAQHSIRHAFFTRNGGVSTGIYASLNGGVGSKDNPEHVQENRRRMATTLGVSEHNFLVPYQIHSKEALFISNPFTPETRPHCDALVTNTPHLALGATGADCGILLLYDPKTRQIGAMHAGWKGATYGILEACVETFVKNDTNLQDLIAVLGPTIAQDSYEIGPDVIAPLLAFDTSHDQFLKPSAHPERAFFNLPGLITHRLKKIGLKHIEDLAMDTYTNEKQFYSYRRTTHKGETDYGRQIAAIVLC